MRILLVGDVVGKPGLDIATAAIPRLIRERGLHLVVVNGENASDGSGITPSIHKALIECGARCITLGDHIYRRKEIYATLDERDDIVKPANFPADAPGRPWTLVQGSNGSPVAVISLLGRVFLRPVDCPWTAVDRVLDEIPRDVKLILVDFHAEATSDKQVMGRYLDGRVSAVLGTHTHVPTADETIFPGGTAFQCDVGMTGPHESILGRRIDRVTETTLTFRPTRFHVADGDNRLNGTIVEVDDMTGRAKSIQRVTVRQKQLDQADKL
ncbi:MAG TPA: YmdB family metallophosphoesterase [Planctomycetes bacterium]|nr:YmdB family metallophosphoesterase [Planctomycetaceae bacterium]HIM31649.1 YmdB family metallophosphoesterase [Planctomycetota bacterium]